MFGFSLSKLILTILVIGAVWYGFKWIGRLQNRSGARRRVRAPGASPSEQAQPLEAQDMVQCAVCGDYVAAGASVDCRRAECPYLR
ncbi:MAG: hypothetical protein QF830_02850 [Rhodospirillales bacterium]|jgi:uncharacterized protein|nr:hypothetical protein [Rhodospirillales bacterium]MDP6883052.1 hypothetical protein [Rhodospirillales bacterium]